MARGTRAAPAKRPADAPKHAAPKPESAKPAASKAAAGASRKAAPGPAKEQMLTWYRDMLMIRRFEERAGQLYGMGLIGGFCHLYIGQEAIAGGVDAAKKPRAQVSTGYRDHGPMLPCGMAPKSVMAELTGRAAGAAKGKGGSMHMF